MSGVKYSRIQLEREQKARQEARNRINQLTANIRAFQQQINTLLAAIPQGVRDSFPQEIRRVLAWQGVAIPALSSEMNSMQLNAIADRLQQQQEEGRACLTLSVEVKEKRREAKARALAGRLEVLKGETAGMEDLLNRWRPGSFADLSQGLDALYTPIETGVFVEVEKQLGQVGDRLRQLQQEVTILQAQDEQRAKVLSALQEVCREMGWGEERAPALEDEQNPASPIRFDVDTYSAGIMTFRLTLEGIKVDSPITREGAACYAEFNNFSERLKKFGVLTKFESLETPEEPPRLMEKGELDLPDEGISQAMEK